MILLVLNKNVYKEFVLPNIDNTDYHIYIDRNTFSVKYNFYLSLEIINHNWRIFTINNVYQLSLNKSNAEYFDIVGGEIIDLKTIYGETFKIIACNNDVAMIPFLKYDILRTKEVTIGSSSDNLIQYEFLKLVSKHHCIICNENKIHCLIDCSSNGVFVNNHRLDKTCYLNYGDLIDVFGLKIIYLGEIIAVLSRINKFTVSDKLLAFTVNTPTKTENHIKHNTVYFNRSPRIFPAISTEQVVIEPPTNPQFSKKKSMFTTIGPSFTMAIPMLIGCMLMVFSSSLGGGSTSAFMYTGIITALGSGILGAFWAFLNIRETKRTEVEEEAKRFNLYGNYLIEMSEFLQEKYRDNRNALYSLYPSSAECCQYSEKSSGLWNRNISHNDFLFYRLGTGDIDFQVDIQIPKEKFSMEFDSLKEKPAKINDNFRILKNVPVGINAVVSNLFGIVGGRHRCYAPDIVNNLIVQISATTSYNDAKIAFCFDKNKGGNTPKWDYIKWLPHTWSENMQMRFFATDKQEASDVFFELSNILRRRAESANNMSKSVKFRPHYFLFVSDVKLLDGELISKYIFDKNNDYGFTTFIITDYYQNLPNDCENFIQKDENFSGIYNVQGSIANAQTINFDVIDREYLLSFAKRLSNINLNEMKDETGLVSTLDFFEMYNADSLENFNISANWHKNRTFNSMRALIGKKSDGSNCYLDIHEKYHGPHGLVAGTTGSGKSELIQTFMLSLAINYSPEDIAFFVIDFKGGGMANLFSGLPHMAGKISNLSGNQISRAMISIKSENMRRQKLFSEYGVNNINLYTRLYKNGEAQTPIPHLLIIIDEFAELKKEEPDFMRELISVAQVGRSLGVHLILATQKPSGTVDDNIWSNAKFRLCLRVQDRQDSNDMLHKPDAAFITQAGRSYLQVGNDEIYELFQSGWSGAVYEKETRGNRKEIATIITPVGKTALVGSHTKMKRKEKEKTAWYSFLYNTIRELIEKNDYDDQRFISESNEVAKEVIISARNKGFKIGNGNSEIRAVKNFISMMPVRKMSDRDAVSYIIAKAAKCNIKLPEIKEVTQLEALVEYISKVAKKENFNINSQLWLPILKKEISLGSLCNIKQFFDGGKWNEHGIMSLNAIVGLYDDPENQVQQPFEIDFLNNGHLAVCGSVVSGKSTFIQTAIFSLALKYSPDCLNFYILDFSSGILESFGKLPHVGGIVRDNDLDQVEKFFTMISFIINERKKLFKGGNYIQYTKVNGISLPAIIIAIDNFAAFKEKTDNAYEDVLINISREGISFGVFLILSSAGFGISEIQNRIGDNIKTVISLDLGDKFKYMDVLRTTRLEVMPESGIKGRGLGYVDGRILEFQTAVAFSASDDYKRNSMIEKICVEMKNAWGGALPKRIPVIPKNPTYDDISNTDDYINAVTTANLVPFAYRFQDASIYSINLEDTYCYSITGKSRTGKTNVLKLLAVAVSKKAGNIVIIEKNTKELKSFALSCGCKYISTDKGIFDYFNSITEEFIRRNVMKKELIEHGYSDKQIFEKMQQNSPIFIFLTDVCNFVDSIYHPEDNIGNMSGFFENIIEKGYLHNIYFFGCINTDRTLSMEGIKAYKSFSSYKTGIHLGGNVAAQRIFDFQNIHYSQMSKPSKKGEGLVPSKEDDTVSEKVIIPLLGGNNV